jgi:predicted transcriptional regulator
MRKTVEILRLKHEVGLTHRQIARSCGLTHPTVSSYLERAAAAGLTWPLPEDMDEERLQALLFPAADQVVPCPTWNRSTRSCAVRT